MLFLSSSEVTHHFGEVGRVFDPISTDMIVGVGKLHV